MFAVGVAVQRVEVIPVVDDVNAEFFGLGHSTADVTVLGVLRMKLDGNTDRVHGAPRARASTEPNGVQSAQDAVGRPVDLICFPDEL